MNTGLYINHVTYWGFEVVWTRLASELASPLACFTPGCLGEAGGLTVKAIGSEVDTCVCIPVQCLLPSVLEWALNPPSLAFPPTVSKVEKKEPQPCGLC